MKLFPFAQKDSHNKSRFLFLKKLNQKLDKRCIREEPREQTLNQVEQAKLRVVAPRNRMTPKEVHEILASSLTSKFMSYYFEHKELAMKVPQTFKINTKNNYMSLKESGGEKQTFYKISSKLGYNFSDDLGIRKKFLKK